MSRSEYKNEFRKDKYDRIELTLAPGMKERIKEISIMLGISVNDYIGRLIKADIEKDHKPEDVVTMLKRWEVREKYHPMIQDASLLPTTGYYIKLKKGFINDYFDSDEILCSTTRELRHVMQFTHSIRTPGEMCGFDSKTYEQLLRWQVPKKHFNNIKSIGNHQITFKDGQQWCFKSVQELRYMWKKREG